MGILRMKRLLVASTFLAISTLPAAAVNFCYVTEFPDAAQPVALMPVLADTQVTVSATTAQSNAFGGSTKIVRVSCDTTVSAAYGTNPTALTTNMRIPANVPEYFYVQSGFKFAFITNQ
jgi:hypothetical protein